MAGATVPTLSFLMLTPPQSPRGFTRRDFASNAVKIGASLTIPLQLKKHACAVEPSDAWAVHHGKFDQDFLKDMETKQSGLLLRDVEKGRGVVAEDGDMATIQIVSYIYESGEKWTNTYLGIPTSEQVVRVGAKKDQKYMRGLNEGLLKMQKGGKRILLIPPYLAYQYLTIMGENIEIVPGGSTLVCYVELMGLSKH